MIGIYLRLTDLGSQQLRPAP